MRALIDADRLPTAVLYYTMFNLEPAQLVKNYIIIDNLDALHNLTLELLLKKLEGYASGGEKEFLIVLHSDPDGLILPVATGAAVNADRSVLKLIAQASVAFDNLDDSNDPNMAVNQAFLNAWMDFFSGAPTFNTDAITQASGVAAKCAEAAKLCRLWIKEVCRVLHTNEAKLRELAALADRVRRADISRLEFRACRLGAGRGLKEVADFFGAVSFAPTVYTFYVHGVVNISKQATLNWIARRQLGGNSRLFTESHGTAGPQDDVAFAIRVEKLPHAKYSSLMYAVSEQAVWNWVSNFISRLPTGATVNNVPIALKTGRTLSHNLAVAGFWTPNSVKPFALPREPEYPDLIEGQF